MSYDNLDNDNGTAVSVRSLSKAYKIFDAPAKRLCYHLFHMNIGNDFWALKDVNFDIKKGEAFGIIGKNGSGKSTMLQILAGIIKQTSGAVKVNGRIAALLELGSGFNPESTGYENIYMNAAILGLEKGEIGEKIKEIIGFADIGDFIYQPVKTYSSGMYVRLAFAVAINVDADIILIDEALAVGDLFFRQKCYAKLNQLKEMGKTIILVTHAMGEVEQFCDRAVLFHKGDQIMLGRSQEVVKKYYLVNQSDAYTEDNLHEAHTQSDYDRKASFSNGWKISEESFYDLTEVNEIGTGQATLLKVGLFDQSGKAKRVFRQGENAYLYYEFKALSDLNAPTTGFLLYDNRNTIVHGKDTLQYPDIKIPSEVKMGEIVSVLQVIQLDVATSDYSIEVGMCHIPYQYFEQRGNLMQEELDKVSKKVCICNRVGFFSVIPRAIGAPTQITFHGHADLAGDKEMLVRKGE